MMEIEVKARAASLIDVESRIKHLGGIFQSEHTHHDTYFDTGGRELAKSDEVLRLRMIDDALDATLCYKGPRIDAISKTREEIEVGIDDKKSGQNILEQLGFLESVIVDKRRKTYKLGDFELSLDIVENLGTFVEIEAMSNHKVEELIERALLLMEQLGIEETETKTYPQLLEEFD